MATIDLYCQAIDPSIVMQLDASENPLNTLNQ